MLANNDVKHKMEEAGADVATLRTSRSASCRRQAKLPSSRTLVVTSAFLAAGLILQFFESDGVRKGVPHSQPALLQVDSSECDYVRLEAGCAMHVQI